MTNKMTITKIKKEINKPGKVLTFVKFSKNDELCVELNKRDLLTQIAEYERDAQELDGKYNVYRTEQGDLLIGW